MDKIILDWTDPITGEDLVEAFEAELDAVDAADVIAEAMFGGLK